MNNRLAILVLILCVVSFAATIVNNKPDILISTDDRQFIIGEFFKGTALLYRLPETEGMEILDMSDAIVTIDEFGPPLNCALINIYVAGTNISSGCVPGVLPDE